MWLRESIVQIYVFLEVSDICISHTGARYWKNADLEISHQIRVICKRTLGIRKVGFDVGNWKHMQEIGCAGIEIKCLTLAVIVHISCVLCSDGWVGHTL